MGTLNQAVCQEFEDNLQNANLRTVWRGSKMSDKAKVEEKRDRRVEFLQEFTLKSMRLKIDKWNKIVVHDEQRQYLQVNATSFLSHLRIKQKGWLKSKNEICSPLLSTQAFLDKEEPTCMVIPRTNLWPKFHSYHPHHLNHPLSHPPHSNHCEINLIQVTSSIYHAPFSTSSSSSSSPPPLPSSSSTSSLSSTSSTPSTTSTSSRWSPRTQQATWSSTRIGQVRSRTKESSLSRGRNSPCPQMMFVLVHNAHLFPTRSLSGLWLHRVHHLRGHLPKCLGPLLWLGRGGWWQRNPKSCSQYLPVSGPGAHFSERVQHAEVSTLCLLWHQEAGWRHYITTTSISPLLNHHQKVHELATAVFQIRGLIKGRTLLPFPQVNRAQWKKTLFRIMSLLYYRVSPTSMMRRNESGKVKEKRSPTNVVVLVVDSFNFLILTFNPWSSIFTFWWAWESYKNENQGGHSSEEQHWGDHSKVVLPGANYEQISLWQEISPLEDLYNAFDWISKNNDAKPFSVRLTRCWGRTLRRSWTRGTTQVRSSRRKVCLKDQTIKPIFVYICEQGQQPRWGSWQKECQTLTQ